MERQPVGGRLRQIPAPGVVTTTDNRLPTSVNRKSMAAVISDLTATWPVWPATRKNEPQQKLQTADFVYARLRKPAYPIEELEEWNQWFAEHQKAKRDVLVFLKHDETGAAPAAIHQRWNAENR